MENHLVRVSVTLSSTGWHIPPAKDAPRVCHILRDIYHLPDVPGNGHLNYAYYAYCPESEAPAMIEKIKSQIRSEFNENYKRMQAIAKHIEGE